MKRSFIGCLAILHMQKKYSWDCPCDGCKIYSKKLYKFYVTMNKSEQGRSFLSPKSFVEEEVGFQDISTPLENF